VDKARAVVCGGDAVIIPVGGIHEMENIGAGDVEYVVVGVSEGTGGKTVVV
jgi:mannose-6-phosphate isomerase-like protein (cupin superfamily)